MNKGHPENLARGLSLHPSSVCPPIQHNMTINKKKSKQTKKVDTEKKMIVWDAIHGDCELRLGVTTDTIQFSDGCYE